MRILTLIGRTINLDLKLEQTLSKVESNPVDLRQNSCKQFIT